LIDNSLVKFHSVISDNSRISRISSSESVHNLLDWLSANGTGAVQGSVTVLAVASVAARNQHSVDLVRVADLAHLSFLLCL